MVYILVIKKFSSLLFFSFLFFVVVACIEMVYSLPLMTYNKASKLYVLIVLRIYVTLIELFLA